MHMRLTLKSPETPDLPPVPAGLDAGGGGAFLIRPLDISTTQMSPRFTDSLSCHYAIHRAIL